MTLVTRVFIFFFQAEDGIRDWSVTGVQTCALPISANISAPSRACSRTSSFPSTAKTVDTKKAKSTRSPKWLVIAASFPADGDVERVEDRKSVVEGKRRGLGGGRGLM